MAHFVWINVKFIRNLTSPANYDESWGRKEKTIQAEFGLNIQMSTYQL
jgi:hypothetical protein